MFYKINPSITPIELEELTSTELTLGILSFHELYELYPRLGFSEDTYHRCMKESSTLQSSVLMYKDYTYGIFFLQDVENVSMNFKKVAFFLKHKLILIVSFQENLEHLTYFIAKTFEKLSYQGSVEIEQLFTNLFLSFISEDKQKLEVHSMELDDLENVVFEKQTPEILRTILQLRKKMILLENYYEQFLNITDDLILNSNEIFDDNRLSHLKQLNNRVERLIDTVLMLSDYISDVKESYQSQLDISLNVTMKLFTTIAAIFMPLTLIVGWYGMNFKYMPELDSPYGYPLVIVFSIVVVTTLIIWFKLKRFF